MALGGKSQKNIQLMLEFLKVSKVLANNADAEDNTSGLLKRGGIADLTLLKTLLVICHKVSRAKFLESDGFFCLSSICKFGSFKNPFTMITGLPKIYFRFRRSIQSVQIKKRFL